MFKFGTLSRQLFKASETGVDAQGKDVVLLLKATGEAPSPFAEDDNTGFYVDATNSRMTMTLDNPYGNNWSYFCNSQALGNSAHLTCASPTFGLGSSDWTVEFFCKFKDTALVNSVTRKIFSQGSTTDLGFQISILASPTSVGAQTTPAGGIVFSNTSDVIGTRMAVNDNKWHHIAFSKSSTQLRCYVDGVLMQTVTMVYNFSSTQTMYWGSYSTVGSGTYYGYISNFRIVVGYGLYINDSFPPPTSPLTVVPGTQYLNFHRSVSIVEASGNYRRTLWAYETSKVPYMAMYPVGPFAQEEPRAVSYFEPVGNSGADLKQGLGTQVLTKEAPPNKSWTLSWWMKLPGDIAGVGGTGAVNGPMNIWSIGWSWGRPGYWGHGRNEFSIGSLPGFGPPYDRIGWGTTNLYFYNEWAHFHVQRDANNNRWVLWINGVNCGINTYSSTLGTNLTLNQGGTDGISTYICDLRASLGCVYPDTQTNIPIPTEPVTKSNYGVTRDQVMMKLWDKNSINFNNLPVNKGWHWSQQWSISTPSSSYPPTITTFSPYITSGWSASFTSTATNGYIVLPITTYDANWNTNQSYSPGAGHLLQAMLSDFTLEFWFYLNSMSSDNVLVSWNSRTLTGAETCTLQVRTLSSASNVLAFNVAASSTANYQYAGGNPVFGPAISTATWYHLAVTTTGTNIGSNINTGTLRAYLNGTEITPAGGWMTSPYRTVGTRPYIGGVGGSSPLALMNGYISNLRFVRGRGIYTGNFTVPNGPTRTVQNAGTNIQALESYDRSTANSVYWYSGINTQQYFFPTNFLLSEAVDGDFTVEFWLNPQDNSASTTIAKYITLTTKTQTPTTSQCNNIVIGSSSLGANDLDLAVLLIDGLPGTVRPTGWPSTTPYTYPSTLRTIKKFQWSHCAVTRQAGAFKVFVNGTLVQTYNTGTFGINASILSVSLGAGNSSTYGETGLANGMYMSNVRIISNQAIYTGNFNPQLITFTTSTVGMSGTNIANSLTGYVSFLGAQTLDWSPPKAWTRSLSTLTGWVSGSVDTYMVPTPYSHIPQAVTAFNSAWWVYNGVDRTHWVNTSTEYFVTSATLSTPKMYPISPFKSLSSYNRSITAGSLYISNQAPSAGASASSANLYWGLLPHDTSDFTVEFYLYIESGQSTYRNIYSLGTAATCYKIIIGPGQPAVVGFVTGAGTNLIVSDPVILAGGWYHIAVCRASGTTRLFVNGRMQGTPYADTNLWRVDTSGYPRIGDTNGGEFYIAAFRHTLEEALYTSNFNIPTRIPQRTTGTAILTTFDSALGAYDAAQKSGIMISGDVRHQPYMSAYNNGANSWYFDGYNDYISVTGTTYTKELSFEYDDFTTEMWIWPQSFNAPNSAYIGSTGIVLYDTNAPSDATGTGRFAIYLQTTATTTINTQTLTTASIAVSVGAAQASTNYLFGGSISINTWTHIAVERKALTTTIYQNGFPVASRFDDSYYNISTSLTNNRPVIGASGRDVTANLYHGYITNLRVIKGYAIHSTSTSSLSFPLPNKPYTTTTYATTNTMAVGFNFSNEVRSYKFGGATAVPASYLHLGVNSNLELNSDFTIEGWFKHNVSQDRLSTSSAILISTTATSVGTYTLQMQTGTTISFFDGNWHPLGTALPSTWHHFALSRKNGLVTAFLDGAYSQTWVNTSTTGFNLSNSIIGTGRYSTYLGAVSTETQFTGFMSNIRVINGKSIYNPPEPLYSTSVGFPGTANGLSVSHNSKLSIASGSTDTLTIEGWWYWNSLTPNSVLFDKSGINTVSFANYQVYINSDYYIALTWGASGSPGTSNIGTVASTVVPTVGQWHHIAFVKSGTTWSVFYDGQRIINYVGLNTASDNNASSLRFGLGITGEANSAYFNGYISNIRINRNTLGPYSASTTTIGISYSPFTTSTGYILLTANTTSFIDVSTASLTVTPGTGVGISSLHPYLSNGPITYNGYAISFANQAVPGSYIRVGNSPVISMDTGPFMLDFWYYPRNFAFTSRIFEKGTDTNPAGFSIDIDSTTGYLGVNNNARTFTTTIGLTRSKWNYCVIKRIGNQWWIWINGLLGYYNSSYAASYGAQVTDLLIGNTSQANMPAQGYMAYIRLQRGDVTWYTGSSVPSGPSEVTTQTVLLLGTGPVLSNAGTSSLTITVTNTVTMTTSYTPFSQYVVKNYASASAEFVDATSSMILQNTTTLPNDVGSTVRPKTLEFWFYRPNDSFVGVQSGGIYQPAPLVTIRPETTEQWAIGVTYNNTLVKTYSNSTTTYWINTSTQIALNTWHHVAYVQTAGVGSLYLNGSLVGTTVGTYDFTEPSFKIGYHWTDYNNQNLHSGIPFFISNLRYVYDTVAYTGPFTPSGPLGVSQPASGNFNAIPSTQTHILAFATASNISVDLSLYGTSTVVTSSSATIFPTNFSPFGAFNTSTTGRINVFSPSTSTLMVYGTQTVLLTANTFTFMDSSPKNVSITAVGTATDIVRSSNPFVPINGLLAVSAPGIVDQSTFTNQLFATGDIWPSLKTPFNVTGQATTRSLFFDGTTDFLTIRDNGYHRLSSGSFTIEGWFFYPGTAGGTLRTIISKGNGSTVGWSVDINASNYLQFTFLNGNTIIASVLGAVPFHRWNHFVVQRIDLSSQGVKIFINGTLAATGFCGVEFNESDLMFVGSGRGGNTQLFIGFLEDIRITKAVRYSGNSLVPPIVPFTDKT